MNNEAHDITGKSLPSNPADALVYIFEQQGNKDMLDLEAIDAWRDFCSTRGYEMMPYMKPFSDLVDIVAWTAQCGEAYVIVKDGLCRIFVDIKEGQ